MPRNIRPETFVVCLLAVLIFQFVSECVAVLADDSHSVDGRAIGAIMPRLSPDGETIAVSYQGAIWKLPRGGGAMTRLTSGEGFDTEPAWSPDGKRISYINSRGFGAGMLTIIDAATGKREPLPRELTVMDKLHFSRDGKRVLGVFQPASEKPRLAWCDLATGELHTAVEDKRWPGLPIGTPGVARQRVALSHDGRWLAVNTVADLPEEQGGNNGPQNDLWQVPLDGGAAELVAHWPARIHEICWRADDKGLFVVTERGGVHNDLWEVPLENGEKDARKLTFSQADEDSPSVSSDGRWMVYSDNRHGPTMLVLRDLKGGGAAPKAPHPDPLPGVPGRGRERAREEILPELPGRGREHAAGRDAFVGREEIIAPTRLNFGGPTGRLHLHVVEGEDDASTTARVVLRHVDGKFHAPPGALYRVLGGDLHFYAHGGAEMELPVGEYSLKAARGPEHRLAKQTFVVKEGQETEVTVKPERWTNQRAAGWISGENHIHANYGYGQWYNSPATMRLQVAGEDLIVANFMVANSDGDGVFDREFFLGRPDPLSTDQNVLYWNEEFRATIWGHMTLINLKHLVAPFFTGFKHTTHSHDVPTNADIADHVHDQDGLVNYTHPAHSLQDPYATAYSAKEMPIDVALGKVDSIDVMGSNHQATYPVWYRLLNCGLKVPASAGTDCFLNRVVSRLPGSDRVYVHCGEKFSYQAWIDNLRAGRTFVTNGPMLRFTVAGKESGSTIKLAGPGKVRIEAEVTSRYPIDKVEVVLNGVVVSTATLVADADSFGSSTGKEIEIERSGWIALRARGPRAPDHHAAELFAHTSPVYLEVAGRGVRSPEDAEFFVKWIERLYKDVRQRNRIPARQQEHVEKTVSQALEFYKRLAK